MRIEDFYRLMEKPGLLSAETLPELKQIVDEFPYFQTARLLYLKNLSLLEDIRFSQELKRMAIYVADRKKLFMLIEGERYGLTPIVKEKDTSQEDKTISAIDAFLSTYIKENQPDTDVSLLLPSSVSSDYIYWTLTDSENKEQEKQSTPLQHQNLIDAFIQQEEERGGARLPLEEQPEDVSISTDSSPEFNPDYEKSLDDSYFTETLARIYIKQKRYEKALEIIQNLRLNYPEKSIYFADQIRFLEKLIINTKK